VVGGGVAMLFELLPQPEKATVRKDIARIAHELRTEETASTFTTSEEWIAARRNHDLKRRTMEMHNAQALTIWSSQALGTIGQNPKPDGRSL
jgi:2-succinyl-5-enolpyruvyl-6-hydroxy-3-cyclohexene-1-carboxylate synthase